MFVKILNFKISEMKWIEKGGGVQPSYLNKAEKELNNYLKTLSDSNHTVVDIKVNHYIASRHNNGGADEVWVQYTIMYN